MKSQRKATSVRFDQLEHLLLQGGYQGSSRRDLQRSERSLAQAPRSHLVPAPVLDRRRELADRARTGRGSPHMQESMGGSRKAAPSGGPGRLSLYEGGGSAWAGRAFESERRFGARK